MKKKFLIIILILVAAGAGIAAYFWYENSKYMEPEILIPEVYENVEYDTDLLIGLWNEKSVFYRYNEDGSGVTWDISDDITEEEGTKLTWEIEHNLFTLNYIMELGPIVPKMYNIKQLELDVLEYYDDYGVNHRFTRVEELNLIN